MTKLKRTLARVNEGLEWLEVNQGNPHHDLKPAYYEVTGMMQALYSLELITDEDYEKFEQRRNKLTY